MSLQKDLSGFGIMGCSAPAAKIKSLLCAGISSAAKKYFSRLKNKEMPEVLELLYGINICVCKACGGRLGETSD